MEDSLKHMIENLISGKDEDAETHFHSYIADKMQSVLEGDDEYKARPVPSSKNKGRLSNHEAMKNVKPKKTRKLGYKLQDEEKIDEEALGNRDKRVKSKIGSFVGKNKGKDSAPGGLKKTSASKTRDLDVSSTTDKSKNL